MKTSSTTVTTKEGSAYIRKLCKHFAHKTETSYTETEGIAEFPFGKALMSASETTLRFDISSESFEGIAKIKYVIVTHLEKFSFREQLVITWQDQPVPPAPDWEEMGRQLRNPTGEPGRKTGTNMNYANMGMIMRAFELEQLEPGIQILEIGPGNGAHLPAVLKVSPGISYTGVEISETMFGEATENCRELKEVNFLLTDGLALPFADMSFDRIVTVNTLYFWENPLAYACEIHRVLKSDGGVFCLAFVEGEFMKNLPFASYGFELYDRKMAENLLENAGFTIKGSVTETETIRSNTGEKIERQRTFVLATR